MAHVFRAELGCSLTGNNQLIPQNITNCCTREKAITNMAALLNANHHFSPFQHNTMTNMSPLTATMLEEDAPRRVSFDENCLHDIVTNFLVEVEQVHPTKRKRVVEPDESSPIVVKKPKVKLLRFLADPIVVGTASPFEHKSDVWYSRDELADIRKNAKCSVMKTTAAHEISNLYHDTTSLVKASKEFLGLRGLERWTSKKHYQTRQVKAKSLRSELWIEQSTQRFLTGYNPVRLATISRNHSAAAKEWARRLAQIDAQQDDDSL